MYDDFFLLPEALMMDIWLKLSIKSTVRFRCVSKPWCASLSDPHFIYKNLTFSSDDDDDQLLLVNDERPYYPVVSHETLIATPLQLPSDPPYNFGHEDVITPPLDDMVCYRWGEEYVGVWNLATGETKVIPRPEFDDDDDDGYTFGNLTLGFGFDEKRKEYKIVQVLEKSKELCWTYKMARDCSFVAYVYTLSSSSNNSWRKVGEPNMPIASHYDGYYTVSLYSRSYRDGTFYWGSGDLIVSFDMSTEVFNYISIPFLDEGLSRIEVIHKLKEGSMLMISMNNSDRKYRDIKYRLWALLDLGVTQSWTNLLVIDLDGKKSAPLGFWRNEVIIKSHTNLGRGGRLIISDPFKREIKEIQTDEPVNTTRCLVWTKGKKAAAAVAASSSSLSGLLQGEEHE